MNEKAAEEPYEPPKPDEPAVLDLVESPAAPQRFKLPDVLLTPVVRSGRHTGHVEFLTDATIKLIVRDGGKTRAGTTEVGTWKPGREFNIPQRANGAYPMRICDYPFRITFVVEHTGDIFPAQQCTDVRFEQSTKIRADHWILEPSSLIGMWEPTPVSNQLESWIQRRNSIKPCDVKARVSGEPFDVGVEVSGALRRFVSLVCVPAPECRLVKRTSGKSGNWSEELWHLNCRWTSNSSQRASV
jgi:hypothetical protein